jgi:transposase-like protein
MRPSRISHAAVSDNWYRRQIDKAIAKAELVRLYKSASFRSGNTLPAKQAFVSEYNRPDGKYSKYYELIGPASFQTFERWRLKLQRYHGRHSCLIDSRGMAGGRNRKAIRRIVSRLLCLIAKVPSRSRSKWFAFLEAMKEGQNPDEIARSVGIHTSTVRKWIRNLGI